MLLPAKPEKSLPPFATPGIRLYIVPVVDCDDFMHCAMPHALHVMQPILFGDSVCPVLDD